MYNYRELLERYGELYVRQLELEASYKKIAEETTQSVYKAVENKMDDSTEASTTTAGQRFIGTQWHAVRNGIAAFVEKALQRKGGSKAAYTLLLADIDKLYNGEDGRDKLLDVLSLTTFSNLLNNVLKKKASYSAITQLIARELFDECALQAFLQHSEQPEAVFKGIDKRIGASYKRTYIRTLMKHDSFVFPKWERTQALTLAASLIQVVLASSTYFETATFESGLEVVATQILLDSWQQSTDWLVNNSYKYCPCVIPPRPWENITEGGYYGELISPHTQLLRLHGGQDLYSKKYQRRLAQLELKGVRKAINAIQGTPWRINKKVLAIMEEVINNGGNLAGIPTVAETPKPLVLPVDATDEEIKKYKIRMVSYYRSETRRRSLVLRALSHLRLARQFSEYERIYFPCNMDFRGRVYPIPSFNFQGDDLNKALIEYADVPPCQNESCYDWLLITGANLAGVDKVSYEDRKKWVLEHEAQIMAVANSPLENLWWAEQDSPCQFLAWCLEYERMVAHIQEHGSIIGFTTGMVVAFDGTCSGLQHFSAALRDKVGGQAVNLIPADSPQDIYGIVADKVNEQLEKDLVSGTEDIEATNIKDEIYTKYGTKTLATIWLAYGVTRKVTKRNVMTLAYGSKEYGFRDQILEDTIKADIDKNAEKSVFHDCGFQAAGYLAKLIWQAVGTTVVAAVEGMKWLQTCARKVTHSNQVVCWMTPMGLPVQQAYMITHSKRIFMRCAGKQLRIYDNVRTGDIDRRTQASGIAPNFIHSMDAAHLQLTTCNCVDKGVKHFAMIHDSFGTSLAQAQLMYDIVRESFVQMYTEHDIFRNFQDNMEALADEQLPQAPNKGTLDINVVLDSKYIFS